MHTCTRCRRELLQVVGEADENYKGYQFQDALEIRFDGGYGMFVDVATQNEQDALHTVICGGCASELIEGEPWIRDLFTEAFGFDIIDSRKV